MALRRFELRKAAAIALCQAVRAGGHMSMRIVSAVLEAVSTEAAWATVAFDGEASLEVEEGGLALLLLL